MKQITKVIGGALIVTGSSVGAGMLALPLTSAGSSFGQTFLLFLAVVVLMTLTGLLVLEATLWMKPGANIISISRETLGLTGEIVVSASFLMFLYAINIAYISESVALISNLVNSMTGSALPISSYAIGFTVFLGVVVYLGTGPVDFFNRFLMVALYIAYFTMAFVAIPHVDFDQLHQGNTHFLVVSIPIIVTAFACQYVIPSLVPYFKNNAKQLKFVIMLGMLLTFCVYMSWVLIAKGVLPSTGEYSMLSVSVHGSPTLAFNQALSYVVQTDLLSMTVRYFSILALSTSFLGSTLSLVDFCVDAFNMKNKQRSRLYAIFVALVPALIVVLINPELFLIALSYAGASIAIVVGIMPAVIVWAGRYHHQFESRFKVFGGKPLLILLVLVFSAVVWLHLAVQFDWLPDGFYFSRVML